MTDRARLLWRRHLRLGWTLLAAFALGGLVLDGLHALKLDFYLAPANETRRLVWTLAHAHGTLLGLIHLGFAALINAAPQWRAGAREVASIALIGAALLMPAGFLLGGIASYGGDPGLGVILVPIGAVLLLIGLCTAVRAAWQID